MKASRNSTRQRVAPSLYVATIDSYRKSRVKRARNNRSKTKKPFRSSFRLYQQKQNKQAGTEKVKSPCLRISRTVELVNQKDASWRDVKSKLLYMTALGLTPIFDKPGVPVVKPLISPPDPEILARAKERYEKRLAEQEALRRRLKHQERLKHAQRLRETRMRLLKLRNAQDQAEQRKAAPSTEIQTIDIIDLSSDDESQPVKHVPDSQKAGTKDSFTLPQYPNLFVTRAPAPSIRPRLIPRKNLVHSPSFQKRLKNMVPNPSFRKPPPPEWSRKPSTTVPSLGPPGPVPLRSSPHPFNSVPNSQSNFLQPKVIIPKKETSLAVSVKRHKVRQHLPIEGLFPLKTLRHCTTVIPKRENGVPGLLPTSMRMFVAPSPPMQLAPEEVESISENIQRKSGNKSKLFSLTDVNNLKVRFPLNEYASPENWNGHIPIVCSSAPGTQMMQNHDSNDDDDDIIMLD